MNRAVAAGLTAFGGIDIVWANAGLASFGPVTLTDAVSWRRCIAVNLLGSFEAVHAALPHVMQRHGMVVVSASAASFAHPPGMSAYAASKAGLDALCNALRLELAPHGVGVLASHPSWIETPLLHAMAPVSAFAALRRAMPGPLGTRPLRKSRTARPRRYQVHSAIRCGADPLDPFSFPWPHAARRRVRDPLRVLLPGDRALRAHVRGARRRIASGPRPALPERRARGAAIGAGLAVGTLALLPL